MCVRACVRACVCVYVAFNEPSVYISVVLKCCTDIKVIIIISLMLAYFAREGRMKGLSLKCRGWIYEVLKRCTGVKDYFFYLCVQCQWGKGVGAGFMTFLGVVWPSEGVAWLCVERDFSGSEVCWKWGEVVFYAYSEAASTWRKTSRSAKKYVTEIWDAFTRFSVFFLYCDCL